MIKHKIKRYDAEFKTMIVKLYLSGRSAISLAEEYGMSRIAVHRWHKKYLADPANAFLGKRKKRQRNLTEELAKATHRVSELEAEVKILKLTVSYYTKTEIRKGA